MRQRAQFDRRSEQGYVLLTLILFAALLAIASLAWIESVDFQLKRDREEELIHRGVQYSRAVRAFYKKFGRYPMRIEELESANRLHFLRKRYKDPITGKDFKLLHMTDVQISFTSPTGTVGSLPSGAARAGFALQAATQAASSPVTSPPGAPAAGGGVLPESGQVADEAGGMVQPQPPQVVQNNGGGSSTFQSPGAQQQPATATGPAGDTTSSTTRVFGGGAIVGVVSSSKEKSIREFNSKNHYNQWQFIYDPANDRGGLLMTPNQPPLLGAIGGGQQPGAQPGNNPQNLSPGMGQNGLPSTAPPAASQQPPPQ